MIGNAGCNSQSPDDSFSEEQNSQTDSISDPAVYIENDGIVSVEFETINGNISWARSTALDGYDGKGYLVWNQENKFQNPGTGVLCYKIKITNPGTYQFIWRSRITAGDTQSEANDSWLRFHDADDFFGKKEGSVVYPEGTGKTPNPEGTSKDGWFKVYMNRLGEWFWRSNTSDRDPHNIFVTFNNPGTYTMEVSGRSQYHGLDRFVLFIEGKNLEEARVAERSEIITP